MNNNSQAAQPLVFTPIALSQKEKVEAIRKAFGNTLYIYTFASLFAWQADEQYAISFGDDAFIVKYGIKGSHAYLFPCGSEEGKKKLIDNLIQFEVPVFYSMTDEDKAFMENAYPQQFRFEECRDDFPYLYDKDAQITLNGKTYKNLRHQINQGRAVANEWLTEPITDANVSRALALNERWAEQQGENILADIRAAQTALHHFSALSMWGLLFQADGEDVAYVAGAFVTPEIFDISFCKVLDKRCDCYIKWLLYSALPQETKTVDSEEDLGLEGLRRHKLLRQPKELTRIWKGSLNL